MNEQPASLQGNAWSDRPHLVGSSGLQFTQGIAQNNLTIHQPQRPYFESTQHTAPRQQVMVPPTGALAALWGAWLTSIGVSNLQS